MNKIKKVVSTLLLTSFIIPTISVNATENKEINNAKTNISANSEEKYSITELNKEKEVVYLQDVLEEDIKNSENINEEELEKANKQTNSANIQTMSAQSTSEIYSTPSGREAIIYGDDNYDYYVVGSSSSRNQTFTITRSDINGKNTEILYKSGDNCEYVAQYVRENIIYVEYIPDYVFADGSDVDTKVRVLAYNVDTGEARDFGTFENVLINTYDVYNSFAVDSQERMYFVSNYKDVKVFEKTGEQIYSFEPKVEGDFEIIINGISPNDKALFFSTTTNINTYYRYCEREGIQKLNNGKFVNETGYTVFSHQLGQSVVQDPVWKFIDEEGKYAINQYGVVAEFNYDVDSTMGVGYTEKLNLMRELGDYVYSEPFRPVYEIEGDKIYIPGNNNIIFVIDKNFEKVARIDLGIGTNENDDRIYRIRYINNNFYVRYHNEEENRKYLLKIENVDEQTEEFENIIYNKHISQTHTKEEIKEKYDSTVSYDYDNSIYKTEPSTVAPYKEGALEQGVIDDTLNRLNFYRWMYGVSEVTLNTDKVARNQKGAVLLKSLDQLTHYPTQPDDMDDSFYEEAYDGCNAKYGEEDDTYSGNCSYGDRTLYEAIDGYISDLNNVTINGGAVGHRMSLLDPKAKQTSYGQCGEYSTLSMYYSPSGNNPEMTEDFYAYPSAGYFPLEQFYTNEYWSLYVTEDLVTTPDFKIELTYKDKKYLVDSFRVESGYPAISFKLPEELKTELGGNGKKMPAGEIEVYITGFDNGKGDHITYNYAVNFFSVDKMLKGIDFAQEQVTITKGVTQKLEIKLNPTDAIIGEEAKWTSSNSNIVDVAQDGTITAKEPGKATITVELEGFKATCEITVNNYKKGDLDRSGKVTATDGFLTYDIYLHEEELEPDVFTAADVDKSGKVTASDAFIIYDAYLHEITL